MQHALSARRGSKEAQTPDVSLAMQKSSEQKGSGTCPASDCQLCLRASNELNKLPGNQRTRWDFRVAASRRTEEGWIRSDLFGILAGVHSKRWHALQQEPRCRCCLAGEKRANANVIVQGLFQFMFGKY